MLGLKTFPCASAASTALDGVTLEVADDERHRAGRPQRRRQDHAVQRDFRTGAPDRGHRPVRRHRSGQGRIYDRARAGIGRTFQIPQPMHELTVRENLMVAQRFGAGRVDPGRIDEILDFLNFAHKAGAQAATDLALSEQKALEVGKALATEPKLLMLDEVLAGLETSGKRAFMTMLARLHREWNLAMIVIEHDIETISRLCQRCVVLNFGKVIADGTPDAVFRDPEVRRSYTGTGAAEHA